MKQFYYAIIDFVTGCTWANGKLFRNKDSAEAERNRLVDKYQNSDLRVIQYERPEANPPKNKQNESRAHN